MKIIPRRRPDGIAIFIVLVAIAVLSALAFGLSKTMKVEMRLANNFNNETELEWAGRSGIELARYVLGMQLSIPNQPFDSMNQLWAGGPGGTNDALTGLSLTDVQLGAYTHLSVKITDNERKFNVNTALNSEPVLRQALTMAGADAGLIPTIVSSIQDWIDADNEPRMSGAESEYYQTMDPPYLAKNAPIDDLSELLLIKGIRDFPEIYWGPNSTNHPPSMFQGRNAMQNRSMGGGPVVAAGLVDLFTPISSGRINLNTASATTLQMIPGIDPNMAAQIIRMRSGPDGVDGTEDDTPLRQPGGQDLINVGLSAVAAQQLTTFCDTRSYTFEVTVDVEVGMSSRRYIALLRRNGPRDVQILHMRWE